MPNRAVLTISLMTSLVWASTVAAQDPPRRPGGRIPDKGPGPNPLHGAIVEGEPQDDAAGKYDQMAEDMEIMSHIIHAAVEEVYDTVSWPVSAGQQSESQALNPYAASLIGLPTGQVRLKSKIAKPYSTYIKGQGVVFQLEAPPLRQPTEPEETSKPDKQPPPSTWERTRMLLRGEIKPVDWQAAGCMECHKSADSRVSQWHRVPADENHRAVWINWHVRQKRREETAAPTVHELADRLVRLLSENGRNLRGLDPEEHVTISVTFRERSDESTGTAAKSSARRDPNWVDTGRRIRVEPVFPVELNDLRIRIQPDRGSDIELVPINPSKPSERLKSRGNDESDTSPPDADQSDSTTSGTDAENKSVYPVEIKKWIRPLGLVDLAKLRVPREEIEGDLHMRQEDYTKAVESYAEAMSQFVKGNADSGYDLKSMTDVYRPHVGRLLRKLCQAHLGLGELDKSSRLLEQLNTLARRKSGSTETTEKSEKSIALPSRLTISATKKVLGMPNSKTSNRDERKSRPDVLQMGGVEFYVPSEK